VSAGWIALLGSQVDGIAAGLLLAWGIFVGGAFAVSMLGARRRSLIGGTLLAVVVGTVVTSGWVWAVGSRWQDVRLAVAHAGWEYCRSLIGPDGILQGMTASRAENVKFYVGALANSVAVAAQIFPGLLAAAALPGMALAWHCYRRVSAPDGGWVSEPFSEFRFSDGLVWIVVLAAALLVLPFGSFGEWIGGNLAVVAGSVYAARGLAVTWLPLSSLPMVVLVALGVGVFFVLPLVLGGLVLLGLADTWVDFRRRFGPATSGG
jgi:hypothetical protein